MHTRIIVGNNASPITSHCLMDKSFKIWAIFNQFSQLLKIEVELLPKDGTTISSSLKNICAQSILVYENISWFIEDIKDYSKSRQAILVLIIMKLDVLVA